MEPPPGTGKLALPPGTGAPVSLAWAAMKLPSIHSPLGLGILLSLALGFLHGPAEPAATGTIGAPERTPAGVGRGSLALHPADGPDADVRVRIDETGVHFSIILNLAFVDEVVEMSREDENSIHPVEYEAMRLDLVDLFAAENRVEIDGIPVTPVPGEFDVEDADPNLISLFPITGARGLTKVRLELDYPAKGAPDAVTMAWGPYPPDYVLRSVGIDPVPAIKVIAVLTAEGRQREIVFLHDDPEFTWHPSGTTLEDLFRPVPPPPAQVELEIPTVSVIIAGAFVVLLLGSRLLISDPGRRRRTLRIAGPVAVISAALTTGLHRSRVPHPFAGDGAKLEDAEALAVFEALQSNIYRAFDYVEEGDVYDALARSVEGPLLDELYTEIYAGLVMQEEGGAVASVDRVELLDATREDFNGGDGIQDPDSLEAPFQVRAHWQVEGVVRHWGHEHRRTNEYRALYTVAYREPSPDGESASPGGWRILENDVLERFRVADTSTDPNWTGPGSTDGPGGD